MAVGFPRSPVIMFFSPGKCYRYLPLWYPVQTLEAIKDPQTKGHESRAEHIFIFKVYPCFILAAS